MPKAQKIEEKVKGGTMTFDYSGTELRAQITARERKEMEDAYLLAAKRKVKVRQIEWMIGLIVLTLVIFGVMIYLYFI